MGCVASDRQRSQNYDPADLSDGMIRFDFPESSMSAGMDAVEMIDLLGRIRNPPVDGVGTNH